MKIILSLYALLFFSSCQKQPDYLSASINRKNIYKIKMLNRSEKNPNDFMAFEPFYLEVKPDNIVKFVLVDKGHGSKSLSIPKKALPWNSGLNNEIEVLLKEEGFYLYECRPHTSMGMVGLIRVGSPSKKNIKETKKKLLELQKNIKMNHKRIEELINLVR